MSKKLSLLVLCAVLLVPAILFAGTASLTWDESSADVTGFKIYYGTASGQYGTPVDVGNVKNYTLALPELPVDQAYFFAVTAYSPVGESAKSLEVSKLIAAVSPPPPVFPVPTNFKSVTVGGKTTLSWDAMPGVDGYVLRVHLAGTAINPCSGLAYCGPFENVTSKTMTLPAGTYDAWVSSASSGTSAGTPQGVTFTVPLVPAAPSVPNGLVISQANSAEIMMVASANDCPSVTFSASSPNYTVACGN